MATKRKRQAKEPAAAEVLDSPLREDLTGRASVQTLRASYDASLPYNHVVLGGFCEAERMRLIHEEAKQTMVTTFKETDLFKVYQTGDLGAVDASLARKLPQLMALRAAIYSPEFRQFVCDITGVTDLTDRIDCSANAYVQGCHLLCHDDVIGTRRVSYIIYLTDPDDAWDARDGGALELYPLDQMSQLDRGPAAGGLQGVPAASPSAAVLPLFNSMALFAVKPGRSYHSVQEVFADKPRLSISGWYHGPTPPLGADQASLSQIIAKGDDTRPFEALPALPFLQGAEPEPLSAVEVAELSLLVNPVYLQPTCIARVNAQFCEDNSVQLQGFLRDDVSAALLAACGEADEESPLGKGRAPSGYDAATSDAWRAVGPPHKRRHLLFHPPSAPAPLVDKLSPALSVGLELHALARGLFRSRAFARLLEALTTLRATAVRDEVRRFRPGLDYTVAHYGGMAKEARLDATLCFVQGAAQRAGLAAAGQPGGDEDDEDDDEDDGDDEDGEDEGAGGVADGDEWASGDVGGFECYIEADLKDGHDSAEAAEVYKGPAADGDDDPSLLSVSPGANVLSLVMRDTEVMRFVKFVSAQAPGSRWDLACEYEIEEGDEEGGEEGGDGG